MSSSPYATAMRVAPKMLFAFALLVFFGNLLSDLLALTMPTAYEAPEVTRDKTGKLFLAIATAMYSAAFPLFGAAILHRIDIFMERRV